jgi:hypothetical protein
MLLVYVLAFCFSQTIIFPRLWEIQCRILNNAISIVRNSAYIFYSVRKSCLGFPIIKLPRVRDSLRIFLRLWENQCRILNNAISIVRNSAYIFYIFRNSSLGFPIIKLPIVRDYVRSFLRLWENHCMI